MKATIEERKEYAKVIAKAWVDEEFKKRLIEDPATVLKENGIEIPEGMTVKVVERKENEILIPLPPVPADLPLDSVVGGAGLVGSPSIYEGPPIGILGGCCGTQCFAGTVARSPNVGESQSRPSCENLSMSDS